MIVYAKRKRTITQKQVHEIFKGVMHHYIDLHPNYIPRALNATVLYNIETELIIVITNSDFENVREEFKSNEKIVTLLGSTYFGHKARVMSLARVSGSQYNDDNILFKEFDKETKLAVTNKLEALYSQK